MIGHTIFGSFDQVEILSQMSYRPLNVFLLSYKNNTKLNH